MISGRLQRAAILLDCNRPREAAELASQEVAASPSDPEAWLMLARSYESMHDLRRALETTNRAIGLDPSDPDAHLIASRVLRSLGDSTQGIRAAHETVRLAPMSAAAHANLAIALTSRGRGQSFFGHFLPRHLRLAADHAAHAQALSPSSTAGHFAAGFVAAASSQPRKARHHYRRVLAMDPQHATALNNLAVLDLGRGRVAKSGSGFARALATDPTLSLARRNVTATLRTLALVFHCLAWLIYFCFSGIAANQEVGPLRFAWTTRCTVACWLAGVYAVLAATTYLRLDDRVRAFATRMVANIWVLKMVLLADGLTLVCFVISTFGQGSAASQFYLVGIAGVGTAYLGLVMSRSHHA
jgi:tetratricopeptide (TPR) repeat protein